jgi:hypothetical protein
MRTGRLHHEEALRVHDLALALTRAARLGLAAGLRARRIAELARDLPRDLHFLGDAPHGFGERELEIDANITAARWSATRLRATTEEVAEQIAERGEDVLDVREAAPSAVRVPAKSVEAEAVVALALIVVAEDLVRVRSFLELLLGFFVAGVVVRVELLREAVVRLLQVTSTGLALDS